MQNIFKCKLENKHSKYKTYEDKESDSHIYRFGSCRMFADTNHAPPSTDSTPTHFALWYVNINKIHTHTSPHTTSTLACAL